MAPLAVASLAYNDHNKQQVVVVVVVAACGTFLVDNDHNKDMVVVVVVVVAAYHTSPVDGDILDTHMVVSRVVALMDHSHSHTLGLYHLEEYCLQTLPCHAHCDVVDKGDDVDGHV